MTHGDGNTTTTMECICGKICKNRHGLQIHQAKMKCMQKVVESQHTGVNPGETQEEPGPESPHSARILQVMQAPDALRTSEHCWVKWHQTSQGKEWLQFDKDTDTILEATAKGEAEQCLKTMTTVIISLAAERFGLEERREVKRSYNVNNRASKIHQLRQLKGLRQQFKVASEEDLLRSYTA